MTSQLSSRASIATLVRAAKRGDQCAVEALVTGDNPLRWMVQSIKRKADPSRLAQGWEPVPAPGKPDEGEAAARLAILEALERFDPDRGVAFTSFAFPFIKGAVLSAIHPRVRRTTDTGPRYRLVDLDADTNTDDVTSPGFEALLLKNDPGYGQEEALRRLAAADERAEVRRFVDDLPDRQRAVVRGLYFDGRSRRDLADTFGVTPQAISKLHTNALARGRAVLDPIGVAA